jgi:hypothetical protein
MEVKLSICVPHRIILKENLNLKQSYMEFKSNSCSGELFRQEMKTVKDVVVYVSLHITCHSNEQDLLFSHFFATCTVK